MGRDVLGVLTGLAVLISGLIALSVITGARGPASDVAATATTQTMVETSTTSQSVEVPVPDLPGVPEEIKRVLYSAGSAEAVSIAELTEIPSSVVRILVQYGVPLRIPDTSQSDRLG